MNANLLEQIRWLDPSLLSRLDRSRLPWDGLSRRIVQAVLAKFLSHGAEPLVEIGAGGGQLRDWLPAEVAARTIHTEPSQPFLDVLRHRHPEARSIHAEATALPFPDQCIASVLGLCVLDAVTDLAAVRDECRRVLLPGGAVIHFLDLSTNPDACFSELIGRGEVPLPNFTQEPGLVEKVPPWLPATDSFDEVLAAAWVPFVKLVAVLTSSRHPLAAKLGPYARLQEAGGLDPFHLGQEFMRARADAEQLRELNHALLKVSILAYEMGRPLPLRRVSLRSHFRERLNQVFTSDQGFMVEFAGPISACERSTDSRDVLRHAGRTLSREGPIEVPGSSVEHLEGRTCVVEPGVRCRTTTIEVFVARRTSDTVPGEGSP